MKQLKFLMVALTLLMGISFTSCMDSNNSESPYDWGGFVLVKSAVGMTYFEDMGGNILYPTISSISQIEANSSVKISDSRFAFIYVKRMETDGATTKAERYDVSLVSFSPCEFDYALTAETKEDMETIAPETAPVITLAMSDGYRQYQPFLFNSDIVVLPMAWRLEKSETIKEHKLALACVIDDIKAADSNLVFYLSHDKGSDDKTENYFSSFYGYDITDAIEEFRAKTGKVPANLIIKAHENGYDNNIPTDYKEYTVEYKVSE